MVKLTSRKTGFWALVLVLAAAVYLPTMFAFYVSEAHASVRPEFDGSYAVTSMWPGHDWRIYVKGSDPDGRMDHIWVVVSQLGGNMWSNHVIPLKGSERKSFSGYITLPIPLHIQQSGWGWQYLKVEMRIRGKDGLYSKPVTHELVIGEPTPSNETLPPEWQSAENHQLGIVFFNFEFQPMGEGSGGETH